MMHAEILTYSRSRGLFAGISLDGSTLRPDNSASEEVYGRKITAREIVIQHKVDTPAAGQLLVATLQKASPTNKSDQKWLKETSKYLAGRRAISRWRSALARCCALFIAHRYPP